MKITYIVGNGFDLGLGLKTSYNDFILQYADLTKPYDPGDPEAQLKRVISKDPKTWEDAEMAFARLDFTTLYRQQVDVKRTFLNVVSKFQIALAEYLKGQEGMVFADNALELQSNFIARIVQSIIEGEQNYKWKDDIAILCASRVELNCINLNYTKTFDRLFCVNEPEVVQVELSTNRTATCSVGKVVHVHGTLDGSDTIFGVSDARQISDNAIRNMCQLSGAFIKQRQDVEFGAKNYDAAEALVRESDWIVIFGTSMGSSDAYWWSTVLSLLRLKKDLRVFVFVHSEDPKPIESKIDWLMLQNDGRSMFVHSQIKDDDESTTASVEPYLDRVTIMRYGPYSDSKGQQHMGDPWWLNDFSRQYVDLESIWVHRRGGGRIPRTSHIAISDGA